MALSNRTDTRALFFQQFPLNHTSQGIFNFLSALYRQQYYEALDLIISCVCSWFDQLAAGYST